MKNSYFRILLFISLLFLAIALYRADYLRIPAVHSPWSIFLSVLFLCAGFLQMAVCYHVLLKAYGFGVPYKTVFAGVGLSIFSKYIPGKIWMVLGPAMYIHEDRGYPLKSLSMVSVNGQLITLWTGLLLGMLGFIVIGRLDVYFLLILAMWAVLSGIIFISAVQRVTEKVIGTITKKQLVLPRLRFISFLVLTPYFILNWAFWAVGFYLYARGVYPGELPAAALCAFPLSGTLGILAVIVPGGLGVREGVLAGYLAWTGVPLVEATSISVFSRLWFIVGEAFIFIIGLTGHRLIKQYPYKYKS